MNLLSSLFLTFLIIFSRAYGSDTLHAESDKNNIRWGRLALTSALAVGVTAYAVDYEMDVWGKSRGKFHFKDDWDGDYLKQSDELSHLFYAYKMTQLVYMLARFDGFSKNVSIGIGSTIAFLWMFSVEYPIDAYNPSQGFGVSDLVFNTIGVAFSALRLYYPSLRSFDFRISFEDDPLKRKSIIAKKAEDYDNMIYWLTYTPSQRKNPISISIGYSTYRPRWRLVKREFYLSVGTSISNITSIKYGFKPFTDFLGLLEMPLVKFKDSE